MFISFRPAAGFATALTLGALLAAPITVQAQDMALDSDQKKYSYAVGTKLAQQLMQQFGRPESGIDMEALAAGIADAVSGGDVLMNDEEATAAIEARQQVMLDEAVARAEEAEARGVAYLGENAAKEGVTVLDSGLQYRVIESGAEDGTMPSSEDTVVVHYRGTLIDGTEFDSSYSRGVPATFPLGGIIPGWSEILQLMRPGDKWEVVIPSALAYGERGAGDQIGPNETLVFEINLIEVKEG